MVTFSHVTTWCHLRSPKWGLDGQILNCYHLVSLSHPGGTWRSHTHLVSHRWALDGRILTWYHLGSLRLNLDGQIHTWYHMESLSHPDGTGIIFKSQPGGTWGSHTHLVPPGVLSCVVTGWYFINLNTYRSTEASTFMTSYIRWKTQV